MCLLASHGAHVIGTGRALDKARGACAQSPGTVTPVALELTDYESVIAAAETVLGMDRPLDVLICNAGIMGLPGLELVEGVEKHFAANHLGHFILVDRLLPALSAARAARVVVLTSMAMAWSPPGGIQFGNLDGAHGYEPLQAYGQSKLANALFTLAFARRASTATVTANCIHPGVIQTGLMRYLPRDQWWPCPQTVEQGAMSIANLACNAGLAKVNGQYFIGAQPAHHTGHLANSELAERLWSVSTRLTARYLRANS